MAEYVRVAATQEIPLQKMKAFEIGPYRFVISHIEAGFFAFVDECSHDGAPISDGRIDRDGNVVCPRHGARFDCQSGDVTFPPAVVGLEHIPLKIEDDDILVLLN